MSELKKRITLVDVVLERKGSMLFEGRKMKIPNDAANTIRDFNSECLRHSSNETIS